MKKLEIKLRHFEELEAIMDKEREAVSCYFCFHFFWKYLSKNAVFKNSVQSYNLHGLLFSRYGIGSCWT